MLRAEAQGSMIRPTEPQPEATSFVISSSVERFLTLNSLVVRDVSTSLDMTKEVLSTMSGSKSSSRPSFHLLS